MTRRVLLVEIGTPADLPVVTPPAPRPPSNWAPGLTPPVVLPPPSGLSATSVADGALLEWTPSPADGARSIVEAAVDNDGAPGMWREVRRVDSGLYLLSIAEGRQWARVRAELNGRTSASTLPVLCTPISVVDAIEDLEQSVEDVLAEQIALQAKIDQEIADRIAEDLLVAQAAAADATAKANAARDQAMAAVDALAAEVGEIVNAPEWDAGTEYLAGWLVRYGDHLYRARVDTQGDQPDESPDEWELIGEYASLADAVAAALTIATQTANELEAEVTRINALYARMPAGDDDLATEAMVLAEAQALANEIGAEASRIDGLLARMPAEDGELATQASVSQVDQASVDRDGALATSIAGVETIANDATSAAGTALTAANNAASVASSAQTTAQGAQSTASQALTVGQGAAQAAQQVALDLDGTQASVTELMEVTGQGATLPLRNPSFEESSGSGSGASVPGWGTGLGRPTATISDQLYSTTTTPHTGNRVIRFGHSAANSGLGVPGITQHAILYNDAVFPVQVGELIRMSFWTRITQGPSTAATIRPYLHWIDENGDRIDYTVAGITQIPISNHGWRHNIMPPVEVPAGAVGVCMDIRTAGGTLPIESCYIYLDDVKLERVSTTEVDLRARHTVALNVNGHVSGTVNENDGETGTFSILAQVFQLIASGTVGMEIRHPRANTYYMRFYAAGAQLVLGINFGAARNLVGWFGPNIGEASCAVGNSVAHATNSGDAYFGGSLSAGVLKNGARSTQLSTTASVSTGDFTSHGNPRVIVASLTFSKSFGLSGNQPVNVNIEVTLQLRRGTTVLASQVITVNYSSTYDAGSNTTTVIGGASGAITHTDSTSGSTFEYNARLINAQSNYINQGTGNAGNAEQTVSIISTEE